MTSVLFFTLLIGIALLATIDGFSNLAPSRVVSRLLTTQSRLSANKLDGHIIEGSLKPMSNNVLVKVKEVASNTAGGLYIPDNAKERPTEG